MNAVASNRKEFVRFLGPWRGVWLHWIEKATRPCFGSGCPHSERTVPDSASKRERIGVCLQALLDRPWKDKNARRLVKRLRRHQHELFTFLDHPEVPYDNNTAERAIGPAVIIGKNSYANRSEAGADMQAVLRSVFRTLKQRGHNPLQTIVHALHTYLRTGQLPPLPDKVAADG